MILKDMGVAETHCLVSTDDEAFTYNSKVNRLAPIQASKMILKALEAGVSEERLGKALNLASRTLRQSKALLVGICPEAIELLKEKPVALTVLRALKKVKPFRQIEMAELMVAAATYTRPYALALLERTPRSQLVDPAKSRPPASRIEDLDRIEAGVQALDRDFLCSTSRIGGTW